MKNIKYTKLDFSAFIILFFIISSDIFFNVYQYPTIRLSQLIIIYLFISYSFQNLTNKLIFSNEIYLLFIFCLLNLLFVPNSGFIYKGIGYSGWLLLNVFLVIYIIQIFNIQNYISIFKLYLYSILFVSIFGLVQFIAGCLGYGDNFGIVMWWVPGVLPRINGFSYEPSFLASYLICGWVVFAYLIEKSLYLYPKNTQISFFLVVTSVLILSGSRIALIMMCIWMLRLFVIILYKIIFLKKITIKILLFFILSFLTLAILFFIFKSFDDNIKLTLLNGTGLMDTPNHSISERFSGFYKILSLIIESPLVGYSLGGLSYQLGIANGDLINNFESSKLEGNGVLLEIFAATGIFGFSIFILFLYKIYSKFSSIKSCSNLDHKLRHMFLAFSYGFFFQFIAIQPNQNILRPYLWLNLGIFLGLYMCCSYSLRESSDD